MIGTIWLSKTSDHILLVFNHNSFCEAWKLTDGETIFYMDNTDLENDFILIGELR